MLNALASYDDHLFAGGNFASPYNSLAVWSAPLAIDQISQNNENIVVYPNPSNGVFTFQSSVVSRQSSVLDIYNMLGERVYAKQLTTGNSPFTIDLSNNTSGIYLYRITTEDGSVNATGKLIVE